MKKTIAVLCALVLLVCAMPLTAFAASEDVPVIILQGYSGPSLVNTDTGEKVWGLDFDKVGERVKEELPNLAGSLGSTFTGDYSQLVDLLGSVLLEVMEPISCNSDGSSKYNVTYTPKGAANTRVSFLLESAQEEYIAEKELVEMLGSEIGYDNIFIFTYDWRMGQIEYANAINEYVQEVKALTNSPQVDIFGLSHGGQCAASYLYYYGTNGDCRKACLTAPAIGGTTMVGDPMTGKPLNLDYATILEFAELGQGTENEWEWLIEFIGFEHLNEVVSLLCQEYIVDYIKTFGSIWDFVPLAVFEDALEFTGLNESNGALYENTVKYHNEAMAHMSDGLKAAQDAGVTIAILSNYGHENVTGSNKNSDYVIDTATSSGAYCAAFDEKFPTDYTCKNTNCDNASHYHISPERNIDATCAYLPDNTWFINGQFHGMYVFDPNTKGFVREFFFGDSIRNVYSNSLYPQFMRSQNAADSLYIQFNNTASGFHTSEDTKLILKNISGQYDIKLRRISVEGTDIQLSPDTSARLAAGKQAEIDFAPYALPASTAPFKITVIYTLYNDQSLLKSQDFEFTAFSDTEAQRFNYLADSSAIISDDIVNLTSGDAVINPSDESTTVEATTQTQSTPAKVSSPKTGTSSNKTIGVIGICIVSLAVAGVTIKKKTEE